VREVNGSSEERRGTDATTKQGGNNDEQGTVEPK